MNEMSIDWGTLEVSETANKKAYTIVIVTYSEEHLWRDLIAKGAFPHQKCIQPQCQ